MSYVRLFHAIDTSLSDLREVQSSIQKIKGLEYELETLTKAIDRIDEKINEINSKMCRIKKRLSDLMSPFVEQIR